MARQQCIGCGNILPRHHLGRLCINCQEKALKKTNGTCSLHYNISDLTEILGLTNEEQTRRLSRAGKIPGRVPIVKRHLFFKGIIDDWIKKNQIFPIFPTNPLQEEAKSRCDHKDHDWLYDERFDGIAYSSEDAAKQQSENVISTGHKRTCYFCGYSTFVSSLYNF
jgi:hypothetical protein